MFGTTRVVGSCHHHSRSPRSATGLRVTATADDGIVEGLELEGTWLLAVQWHPEDTAGTDPTQQRLFDALVEHAARLNWTKPSMSRPVGEVAAEADARAS